MVGFAELVCSHASNNQRDTYPVIQIQPFKTAPIPSIPSHYSIRGSLAQLYTTCHIGLHMMLLKRHHNHHATTLLFV